MVYDCWKNEEASQNAEYIEHAPVEMEVLFMDSNKVGSGYGTINLYLDSVFRITPKGLDVQMMLDPFEKLLHGVVHNSAKSTKIFLTGLISGKIDSLITDNLVAMYFRLTNKRALDIIDSIKNLCLSGELLPKGIKFQNLNRRSCPMHFIWIKAYKFKLTSKFFK